MRPDRRPPEESGEDSFLDVVANVVGVLIILVMLVGVRATRLIEQAQAEASQTADSQAAKATVAPHLAADLDAMRGELDDATRQALAAQREIQEMATRVATIGSEAESHDRQRINLAMHRAVIEEDLERRRNQLDDARQQEYDVQRELVELQLKLDELIQEQLTSIAAPAAIEEVECVPTPLAKVVDGQAIHLRLSKGLVSIVPLEELLAEVRGHLDGIRRRLQSGGTAVETIGPIDGYRLRYTVTTHDAPGAISGPLAGQIQRAVHDQYAEVLPISDAIGVNVEQALMPGATLHTHLQAHRQRRTPVVVWLYTDSFEAFRPLKRAVWEMGFSLATRPMRPGTNIGASPHGTRAAAQ